MIHTRGEKKKITTWKLFSGVIAAKLSQHMCKAENVIVSNSNESKDQLLVDRAVTQDSAHKPDHCLD